MTTALLRLIEDWREEANAPTRHVGGVGVAIDMAYRDALMRCADDLEQELRSIPPPDDLRRIVTDTATKYRTALEDLGHE